jgi:hypothetical protein
MEAALPLHFALGGSTRGIDRADLYTGRPLFPVFVRSGQPPCSDSASAGCVSRSTLRVEDDRLVRGDAARMLDFLRDQAGDCKLRLFTCSRQDAGCEVDEAPTHSRGETIHVRGCWVLDAILGYG